MKAIAFVLLVLVGCTKGPPKRSLDGLIEQLEGEGCPALARALEHLKRQAAAGRKDFAALRSAALIILGLGDDQQTRIVMALMHASYTVRTVAIAAAPKMANHRPAIAPLVDCLGHEQESVCVQAANVLKEFGAEPVEALKGAIQSTNGKRRWWAARVLLMRGQELDASVLAPLLGDEDPDIAALAAARHALEGLLPKKVIPILRRGLDSDTAVVRRLCATGCVGYREKAVTLAPRLIKCLADQELEVRHGAATALLGIGDPAVPLLTKGLWSKDAYTRLYSAQLLGWLGAASDEIVDGLIVLLRDPDTYVKETAEEMSVDDVTAFAGDKRKQAEFRGVRAMAALTLARLGPKAKRAVPYLVKALGDENPAVRMYAVGALGRIGVKSGEVLAVLNAARNDKNESVGKAAAEALRAFDDD